MMEEIEVSEWEEFEAQLADIRRRHTSRFFSLLFRGHASSDWKLDTTLDRSHHESMKFDDYYRITSGFHPEVETLTGNTWVIPQYPDLVALVKDYGKFSQELTFGRNPAYNYLAYLRHHGFPTPLLDWTRSPYIAAYFAFSKAIDAECVSIYALSEGDFHSGSNGVPKIYCFGPRIRVHRRHVIQQSEYTMCLVFNDDGEWRFAKHDDVRSGEIIDGTKWDIHFTKINIPSSERRKVLSLLDEHNVNAFSLFGSEESLMETLRIRKLEA